MTGNSFDSRATLTVGDQQYEIHRLDAVEGAERLPFSLKILLENLLRTEDGSNVTAGHVRALAGWDPKAEPDTEIQFSPARVIRSSSVSRLRSSIQAVLGSVIVPIVLRSIRIVLISSFEPVIPPATRSEWPPAYLVRL